MRLAASFAAMLFAATSSVLCVPVRIEQRAYNEAAAAPVPAELDALWKRNPSLCALLLHIALDLNLRSPSEFFFQLSKGIRLTVQWRSKDP